MKKPFFFRIESADLLDFATDPEGEGMSLLRFAKELQKGESDIVFIQQIIDETHNYIETKRKAGSKGGQAKASTAKAKASTPLASSSSSSSSSTEAVAETKEEPKDKPSSPAKADSCPHVDIIDAYHRILPSLPFVNVWNDTSKANLRSRWREDKERQTVEWWENFFYGVAESDFLTGKVKDWRASLTWLVGPKNFEKVMNGIYFNNQKESFGGDW